MTAADAEASAADTAAVPEETARYVFRCGRDRKRMQLHKHQILIRKLQRSNNIDLASG